MIATPQAAALAGIGAVLAFALWKSALAPRLAAWRTSGQTA